MTARKTVTLIASLAIATALVPAYAANWTPADGQDPDAPNMIYTETDTGAALLACSSDGKFITSLSKDNDDFDKRMKSVTKYSRGAKVALEIGERAPAVATWKLMPAINTVFSADHGQAAKVFNATVRGEPVSVKVDGKPYATLELPEIDETFKAFASSCKEKRNND